MLTELHTELIGYLSEKLTGVTVEAFTPAIKTRRATSLPGCLIEMNSIEPSSDFGNARDRSRVYLNFEALILVDPNLPNAWVELKEFAGMAWWALRDWIPQTANLGPINLKHAGEDAFKPDLDGYLVWSIEWEQEAYLNYSEEEVLPLITKITIADSHKSCLTDSSKRDVHNRSDQPVDSWIENITTIE
ncbi:hypothetical protein [Prosthecochloris sp.]|uniref:hypothetical protein n=1 Tax=Prosthecochloris sp. TaxID=290513 RepID=UPI0025E0787E|nr:hypothetical protein [Prosthecochloris sp.]